MWYEKSKKIIKIVALCLLLAGSATSYVLYKVYPEQTQLVLDKIIELMGKPVPIICCSVGALIVGVFTIFSKTSIGKKFLNTVRDEIGELTSQYEKTKTEHQEYKEETQKFIEELKSAYEEKLAVVEYNRDLERQFLINALSQIHNKNIEELVEEYKESIKPNDISELVNSELEKQKLSYEEEMRAYKEELLLTYKNEIAKIDTKTAEINEKVNDVVESVIGE